MRAWRRWQDYATMVFGVLLFVSPVVFGETSHQVAAVSAYVLRSEEHTSELQSQSNLVCRLLLEKKKQKQIAYCRFTPHSRPLHLIPDHSLTNINCARSAFTVLLLPHSIILSAPSAPRTPTAGTA